MPLYHILLKFILVSVSTYCSARNHVTCKNLFYQQHQTESPQSHLSMRPRWILWQEKGKFHSNTNIDKEYFNTKWATKINVTKCWLPGPLPFMCTDWAMAACAVSPTTTPVVVVMQLPWSKSSLPCNLQTHRKTFQQASCIEMHADEVKSHFALSGQMRHNLSDWIMNVLQDGTV